MTAAQRVSDAVRDVRDAWRPRTAIAVAAFTVAAFAPLVFGESRVADLASGLYLAAAADRPRVRRRRRRDCRLLAQGAFIAVGAVAARAPRLNRARRSRGRGRAAAPWRRRGRQWRSCACRGPASQPRPGSSRGSSPSRSSRSTGSLGGTQGIVIAGGPSPVGHYELALGLTAAGRCSGTRARAGAARSAARSGARPRAGRGGAAASRCCGCRRQRSARLGRGRRPGRGARRPARRDRRPGAVRPVPLVQALRRRPDRRRTRRRSARPPACSCSASSRSPRTRSARSSTSPPLGRTRCSRRSCCSASSRSAGTASCGPDCGGGTRRAGAPPERARRRPRRATDLTKRYGAIVAADGVALDVAARARSPLSSGRTVPGRRPCCACSPGACEPDAGSIERAWTVVRTLQATAVFPTLTALEHVLAASRAVAGAAGWLRSLFATPKARA